MPYDLHIIRAGDFLRLGAHGRPDLTSSRKVLADLAAALVRRGLDRALIDVRGVKEGLSTPELFSLATTFAEAGFRQEHRLAVLHRWNRMAQADFFALCCAQKGWNVAAFDAFEEAFDWLMPTETSTNPTPGFGGVPGTQQQSSHDSAGAAPQNGACP